MARKIQSVSHLVGDLECQLVKAIESGGSEPDIVEKFVRNINAQPYAQQYYPISKNVFARVRAKCINAKPLIFFPNYPKKSPCGVTRMELGDILYRIKIKHANTLKHDRISIAQAKLSKHPTRSTRWKIPKHQQEFMFNPFLYPFEFGKKYNIHGPWLIKPTSAWLFHYLLTSKRLMIPFTSNPQKVYAISLRRCKDLSLKLMCQRYPHIFNPFRSFLLDFIRGKIGSGIIRNKHLQELVNVLYELVGLKPDPIEDFLEYLTDGVFAVIEITIIIERG